MPKPLPHQLENRVLNTDDMKPRLLATRPMTIDRIEDDCQKVGPFRVAH